MCACEQWTTRMSYYTVLTGVKTAYKSEPEDSFSNYYQYIYKNIGGCGGGGGFSCAIVLNFYLQETSTRTCIYNSTGVKL